MKTRGRLRRRARPTESDPTPAAPASDDEPQLAFEIAPGDPLLAYFQESPGPVEIDKLRLDSPGLAHLRASGVRLAVPLVSQGELIGVLSLGPRLSEQDYSADDRKLLDNLASQAAPALRVAQLVREQEAEARTRERYEQELRLARLIQESLLPKQAPELAGWSIGAFYRSAAEVGGDLYDFILLEGGRIGIVIGDVTDHGVPAALMMASTRSVVRSIAQKVDAPGDVLAQANDLLCPDMPPKMFVTCLYAVLEPTTGHMVYANAGHNVPYRKAGMDIDELKARGMPLGLMPGSPYEEKEVQIGPGEEVLFTSDGIAEAHNPDGEMFGCPRIIDTMRGRPPDADLRDAMLDELDRFTGHGWEQEDDITMVVLQRTAHGAAHFERSSETENQTNLGEFTLTSQPGNERQAMARVEELIAPLDIDQVRLDKLKTAVAEATMNAIEHGNKNNPDLPVGFEVFTSESDLVIRITDHGGGEEIPESTAPDLDAKLRGEQTPRGWGLFLIKAMVDDMRVSSDDVHHTVELVVHLGKVA
jgi:serine phosphatase RsbU (regulator of sigma subunit)/anti-sigma regulatory factor (Ser/Thr protein kinase)